MDHTPKLISANDIKTYGWFSTKFAQTSYYLRQHSCRISMTNIKGKRCGFVVWNRIETYLLTLQLLVKITSHKKKLHYILIIEFALNSAVVMIAIKRLLWVIIAERTSFNRICP